MLLLALALWGGGAAPEGLPEGNAYVRGLVERHRQGEDTLDRYAYDVTERREELDGHGLVRVRHTRRYEVFHVRGRQVRTLVEEDGKPLPGGRAARQQAEARAQVEAIASGSVAIERPAVRLWQVMDGSDFRTVAREDVDGRPALLLEFEPRPGADRASGSGLLRGLAGRVWIDEADGRVVRARMRSTRPLRVGGGLGASISSFELELSFQKVDGVVWLPLYRQATVAGRKLLFQRFRVRSTSSYGAFRRFSVETEEK